MSMTTVLVQIESDPLDPNELRAEGSRRRIQQVLLRSLGHYKPRCFTFTPQKIAELKLAHDFLKTKGEDELAASLQSTILLIAACFEDV